MFWGRVGVVLWRVEITSVATFPTLFEGTSGRSRGSPGVGPGLNVIFN
jgi:hypothetical protein